MLARFANDPSGTPPRWLAAAERLGMSNALEASLVAAGITRPRAPAARHLPLDQRLARRAGQQRGARGPRRRARTASSSSSSSSPSRTASRTTTGSRPRSTASAPPAAHVAVEDAGAGYDSLQHVLRLRPEYVKLDRGLITDAHADPAKLAIIEAVGLFAGRLGAALVAPGIERRAEQEMLAGLAVPLGQGYLFGRPGPSLVRDVPIAGLRPVTGDLGGPARRARRADARRRPARRRGRAARRGTRAGRRRAGPRRPPVGLLVPEGGGWAHRERPLTASVEEPAIEVARRALARSAATRLDPDLRVPARRPLRRPGRRRAAAGRPRTAPRTRPSCFLPVSDARAQARRGPVDQTTMTSRAIA